MLLMHSFVLYIYTIEDVTQVDVINSNVHRNERNLVMLGWRKPLLLNMLFKTYESFMLLHAVIEIKNELFDAFSQSFQVTK